MEILMSKKNYKCCYSFLDPHKKRRKYKNKSKKNQKENKKNM
jgi:hypothetical protein